MASATDRVAKGRLAAKLLQQIDREPGDRQYAALILAWEQAVQAEDGALAWQAIEQLSMRFRIATLDVWLQGLADLATCEDGAWLAASAAIRCASQVASLGDFAAARKLVDVAIAHSAAVDRQTAAWIEGWHHRVEDLEKRREVYLASSANPPASLTPAARAELGICRLLMGHREALATLVLGDDESLRNAARLSMQMTTSRDEHADTAAAWWKVATGSTGGLATVAREFANKHALRAMQPSEPAQDALDRGKHEWLRRVLREMPEPRLTRDDRVPLRPEDWGFLVFAETWRVAPATAKQAESITPTTLRLRNTTGVYTFARAAFLGRRLLGDFIAQIEVKGQVRTVDLADAGLDQQWQVQVPNSRWSRVVLQRRGDTLTAWVDGEPRWVDSYRAPPAKPGYLALPLSSNGQCEIRSLAIRGGSPHVP
ncbi:MAG: hypothetical protein R3F56_11220 [Planctomycetota bacterium]